MHFILGVLCKSSGNLIFAKFVYKTQKSSKHLKALFINSSLADYAGRLALSCYPERALQEASAVEAAQICRMVLGWTLRFCPAGFWLQESGQARKRAAVTVVLNACRGAELRKVQG